MAAQTLAEEVSGSCSRHSRRSSGRCEHFTRAAAKELGPRGISANNVAPGPMDTPFFYPAEDAGSTAYHQLRGFSALRP